jgi:hypothetical protein
MTKENFDLLGSSKVVTQNSVTMEFRVVIEKI